MEIIITEDKCPICGNIGGVTKKIFTETFEYKNHKLDYPNYIVYECGYCGESIVDGKTLRESGVAIREFYERVDNGEHK